MPPRGWTSGRPEGIVKAVRLREETVERIARHIDRLQAQLSYVSVNEGMAIRNLIEEGLDTVEAREFSQGVMVAEHLIPSPPASKAPSLVPHETLTPQPQAPSTSVPETPTVVLDLDTEPETGPLQPVKPSMVPVGMQQCSYGHSPYPMATKACPDCVRNRNRRQRQPQPDLLPAPVDTEAVQEQPSRHPGRQSTVRQPILDLLREHPEGLTAVELKVHLKLDKNIGDTLAGMVKNGLLEKMGSGQAVRYMARESL